MNFAIVNADYKWWEAREFRPVLEWAATHYLWQRGKKREKNKWECTYVPATYGQCWLQMQ